MCVELSGEFIGPQVSKSRKYHKIHNTFALTTATKKMCFKPHTDEPKLLRMDISDLSFPKATVRYNIKLDIKVQMISVSQKIME